MYNNIFVYYTPFEMEIRSIILSKSKNLFIPCKALFLQANFSG